MPRATAEEKAIVNRAVGRYHKDAKFREKVERAVMLIKAVHIYPWTDDDLNIARFTTAIALILEEEK